MAGGGAPRPTRNGKVSTVWWSGNSNADLVRLLSGLKRKKIFMYELLYPVYVRCFGFGDSKQDLAEKLKSTEYASTLAGVPQQILSTNST